MCSAAQKAGLRFGVGLAFGLVLGPVLSVGHPADAFAQTRPQSRPAGAHANAQSGSASGYPAPCSASMISQTESDKAHAIYTAGKVQYDDGNYDAAIMQFRDAYRRDCSKHDLLIIIARAHELKGDKAEAIAALEAYLERVPTSPEAASHRTRIENLKKQLVVHQEPAAPPAPPRTEPPPKQETPPPQEVRGHTALPWVVVGLGVAAMATGAIVIATAPSMPPGCSSDTRGCTEIPGESAAALEERQSQAGAAENQPFWGVVVLSGGAVITGLGLLWHFLEPTGTPVRGSNAMTTATKPTLRPVAAPGYAGLDFAARF